MKILIALEPVNSSSSAQLPEGEASGERRFSGARLSQHQAGRRACTRLLDYLQIARETAVGTDARGAPLFPIGIAGSISHSDFLAAVAMHQSMSDFRLGIDIEPLGREQREGPVPESFLSTAEIHWLQTRAHGAEACRQLLFCCKEASWKALKPDLQGHFSYPDMKLVMEEFEFSSLEGGWKRIGEFEKNGAQLWAHKRDDHIMVLAAHTVNDARIAIEMC